MADFTHGFWSLYVALATLASIVACLWLLAANSRKPPPTPDNTTGHVWDEDLREANNPLPRWWVGLFVLTIVFSIGYLIVYPGLGSFQGAAGWSQASRYDAERAALNARIEPIYAAFAGRDAGELVGDPRALAIGERLFMNNCAQCHASDGRGSKGFPNLTDTDWNWGGSPESVHQTIAKGRVGVMPPMAAAVGSSVDVERLAHYVLSLSGASTDAVKAELGRGKFSVCAACHGPRGEGNQTLGAPNLTDKIWLHGGGLHAVIAAINTGFNNQMPAHDDKLTGDQIRVLTAYVLSLSRRPASFVLPTAPIER
ncbi:MAG TPA: cytochrome-c oxidase, cbb3-type subunit III [Burkholderiaceae bacterium]|nr:cytochrome-c oxidase, cbb3-type subunit III [Burkholderiaceae bacterium]